MCIRDREEALRRLADLSPNPVQLVRIQELVDAARRERISGTWIGQMDRYVRRRRLYNHVRTPWRALERRVSGWRSSSRRAADS